MADPLRGVQAECTTLTLQLPTDTRDRLVQLAQRRGVTLDFLFDELATMALFEDEAARRLVNAGTRTG